MISAKFKSLRAKVASKLQQFKATSKKKGFTLMEILVACAIIIALSVGAFFAYQQAQQTRKIAQMNQDMEAITNAALSYEAMSLDSTPPASIQALITGLSADESVDGAAHTFLTQVKGNSTSTESVLDPWGTAYVYDSSARTVECTPKDPSGAAYSQAVTRHF